MKKIIKSLGVIAAMSVIVIGATRAYFFDTKTSAGNTFIAGTIDLGDISLDGDNVAAGTLVLEDVKPCEELGQFYVRFHNDGQNEGKVSWVLSYDENDKPNDETFEPDDEGVNLTADQFAMLVFVDYAVFDRDTNGYIEPFGADGVCAYDGKTSSRSGTNSDPIPETGDVGDLNQDGESDTVLDYEMAWVLANWASPISYANPWPGAPLGIDDEWVLPDWARWGDMVNGNNDGYLSLYEIATLAAGNPTAWSIDDLGGLTMYMDPGETYIAL